MEATISTPSGPIPAPHDRRGHRRGVNIALLSVTLINLSLIAVLILIEQREPAPVGTIETNTQSDSAATTEPAAEPTTATAAAVEIPEDYVCTEYDLAQYEQYADGEHNEEYFVADAYSTYLDVIGDMLYCTFMIGWPADGDEVELTIEVWDEVDEAAALDTFAWDRGNWEVGTDGTLEDYSGLEGDGFVYEGSGPETFTKIELMVGTSIASGTMQSAQSLDAEQTRSILLDMIDQAWIVNALNPR
ncbi:hypothetical protein [Glycomyces sp. NPDC021274]|uniref:hypothetical protein n=1 Tax=Glycomyces sp. NPDC021274 TaxID=3155120 RepID=UPI0033E1D673